MIVQPRMTGSLVVHDRALTAEEKKYAVLICTLDDGRLFVYRDVRRLGTVWLLDERGRLAHPGPVGPAPLDQKVTPLVVAQPPPRTHTAVEEAVKDQRRLACRGIP